MPVRFEVYVVPGPPRPGPDGRHAGAPRVRVVAGTGTRTETLEADPASEALSSRLGAVFGS